MPPNTPFAEYTVKDTIVHGSYFYNSVSLEKMFFAQVQTFLYSNTLSIDDHPSALPLLSRIMVYMHTKLVVESTHPECKSTSTPIYLSSHFPQITSTSLSSINKGIATRHCYPSSRSATT